MVLIVRILSSLFIFAYFFVSTSGQINNVLNDTSDVILNLIDTEAGGRVVNGTKANFQQFPYQVSLRSQRKHLCGGSIIDQQWILTAAHCVTVKLKYPILGQQAYSVLHPSAVSIVAGQTTLQPELPYSQRGFVKKIFVHDDFNVYTLASDVALLMLTSPLNFTESNVQAIQLAENMPMPGTVCKVSGWGDLTETNKNGSDELMYISLPIINNTRCQQLLEGILPLHLGHFCAGYENGFMDTCNGDSGGGVICGDVLAGIVSAGKGCARPNVPGTYVDVSHYRSWIESVKKNNSAIDKSKAKFPAEPDIKYFYYMIGRNGNGVENVRCSFPIYFICIFVFYFNLKNVM